jgi:hypothetical protein
VKVGSRPTVVNERRGRPGSGCVEVGEQDLGLGA